MRYLLAVFVCLSLAAHAQLDRIGGYMGKTSPSIKDDVRRTSSNPFKARVSRDVFIRDILPEVKGSYGATEDGRVIQTARYALDVYGLNGGWPPSPPACMKSGSSSVSRMGYIWHTAASTCTTETPSPSSYQVPPWRTVPRYTGS